MPVLCLCLAVNRWNWAINGIPTHLLSPPTSFCCPSDKCLSFCSGSAGRGHSLSSQQVSICLGMSLCCSAFYGSEILRRVGGRKEIPGLREASPLLGQEQAEKWEGCWRLDGAALPTAHSPAHPTFTMLSLLCLYQAREIQSLEIKADERKSLFFILSIWCSEN